MIRRAIHHAARRRGGPWPLAARAQQGERMRRVGVLVAGPRTSPISRQRLPRFRQGLESLGWSRVAMSASTIALRRQGRSVSGARERTGRPTTRRDPCTFARRSPPRAAGEPRDPHRVRHRLRPDRLRLHCEPGAARRQYHRLCCMYEAGITGKWLAMLKEIAPLSRVSRSCGNPKTRRF